MCKECLILSNPTVYSLICNLFMVGVNIADIPNRNTLILVH